MPTAPIYTAPTLPELQPGERADLAPRAVVEARQFVDTSFDTVELTDAVLTECELTRVSIVDSSLRGIRISESIVTTLNAPVLAAPLSQWRDVELTGSRLGSAELFESTWHGARIAGSKIGYLNLRGAELVNVIIEDCSIDELDLGGARATRIVLRNCTIGILDLTRTVAKDVDIRGSSFETVNGLEGLRGVTIDEVQLAALSWHLASAAGIRVE